MRHTAFASDSGTLPVSVEDLPGIGRRYDVLGRDGGRLSVVIHRRSGEREVFAYGPDEQQAPAWAIRLSDEQARHLGSILGGAFFKTAPVEELEAILGDLTIDWLTVPAGSPFAGRPSGRRPSAVVPEWRSWRSCASTRFLRGR